MKRNLFFGTGKLILVLAVFLTVSGAFLCAESPVKDSLQTIDAAGDAAACGYEGADLELFNQIKDTSWCPKLKGFFEVTNPITAVMKKSDRLMFRANGEAWLKSGSYGAVVPYRIQDGMIYIENHRFVYDAENDRIKDLVGGRVSTRVDTDKKDSAE